MMTVTVRDESIRGEQLGELTIEIPSEQITVRELIRSRVYQEVKEANARALSQTKIVREELVQPAETELALNGQRAAAPTPVGWQSQFDKAVDAFCTNRIMILIDDRQVKSLDEEFELNSDTKISFLRMTMLMGG